MDSLNKALDLLQIAVAGTGAKLIIADGEAPVIRISINGDIPVTPDTIATALQTVGAITRIKGDKP